MDKKEAIKKLVEDYKQPEGEVTKLWDKIFESDIVQEMTEKGHEPIVVTSRMVKANLADKYSRRPGEKAALHVLSKSDIFTNKSGNRQVNITGIGIILKEKKPSFVTILNIGEEPVAAAEAVEVGKSYKGEFNVGSKRGNEVTFYFTEGRSSYKGAQLKLPGSLLDVLRKLFTPIKLNQVEDLIKEGDDYTTYAVEAQVINTFTRPRKNGGQTAFYTITDDSLSHEDEVAMGGGLDVLVSPNLLKFGRSSTIFILGRLRWFTFDDGSRRPSMNGEVVIPVVAIPQKVDNSPKPPTPGVADPDSIIIKDEGSAGGE